MPPWGQAGVITRQPSCIRYLSLAIHLPAMFITELSPLFQELVQKPVAFTGGFVSGLLRLNLSDDPVRQWLDKQMGAQSSTSTPTNAGSSSSGPQSISID